MNILFSLDKNRLACFYVYGAKTNFKMLSELKMLHSLRGFNS